MTDGLRDFSRSRQRNLFQIDDDVFEAAPALPAQALVDIAARFEDFHADAATVPDKVRAIQDLLGLMLLPEAMALFTKRMASPDAPIELDQAAEVAVWLLEVYGLRPTMPSSSSATGSPSPDTGTRSTETTSPAASTSSPSPQTAS